MDLVDSGDKVPKISWLAECLPSTVELSGGVHFSRGMRPYFCLLKGMLESIFQVN